MADFHRVYDRPQTHDRPGLTRLAAVALLPSLLMAGCSGQKEPETLPSQTVTKVSSQIEPPPALPPLPPIREVPTTSRDAVKVIEEGGTSKGASSLLDASRLAKERRSDTGPVVAEINDENIGEYAVGGSIIVLESEPAGLRPEANLRMAGGEAAGEVESFGENREEELRDEAYWRTQVLDLRTGWRRALDEIDDLELQNAALRQQFYSEDDPYIRDTQVKPAWDRVLDRLDALRRETGRYEAEIEALTEEGREAGAQPGWLAEGWELEPSPEERERIDKLGTHRAVGIRDLDEENEP